MSGAGTGSSRGSASPSGLKDARTAHTADNQHRASWCRQTYTCTLAPSLRMSRIVYGSTKGFVSYGGFTHVGFPLRTSVSPPTLYPSSLQLPLSPLSPSPVTTFPSSSLSCSPFGEITTRRHRDQAGRELETMLGHPPDAPPSCDWCVQVWD